MEPISQELYKKLVKLYESTRWSLLVILSKVNNYLLHIKVITNFQKLFKFIKTKMNQSNTKSKTIEKEKVVAETLNGRFAMIGLIAAIGAYLTTGQIIPGFV